MAYEKKIIKNIDECAKIWEEFSPKKSLYDLWEYRFCFWDVYRFEPHFILLKNKTENVGLLPLWYIPENKKYYWFGDVGDEFNWQEGNDFWVKDESVMDELIKCLPESVLLTSITEDTAKNLEKFGGAKEGEPKYVLDLTGFKTIEDYLQSLDQKKRGNLRRDQRAVEALNPIVNSDRTEDFDKLIKFNMERFQTSPFKDVRLINVFKKIIDIAGSAPFKKRIISVDINGETVGVDLIFIYNHIYYPLLTGAQPMKYSGLGHYLNMLDIKDALDLGMEKMDFAEDSADSYKGKLFQKTQLYYFSK